MVRQMMRVDGLRVERKLPIHHTGWQDCLCLEVGDLDERDSQLVHLLVDLLHLCDGQRAVRLSIFININEPRLCMG